MTHKKPTRPRPPRRPADLVIEGRVLACTLQCEGRRCIDINPLLYPLPDRDINRLAAWLPRAIAWRDWGKR